MCCHARENLSGWLYTSAHFAAAKAVRAENRRRDREEKFMRDPIHDPAAEDDWAKIRPVLDEAMHELKEADREAILLRYFENRQFAEVGARLNLNENAARMRVDRALEKLRAAFARRGITATTALAPVISANAVQTAPGCRRGGDHGSKVGGKVGGRNRESFNLVEIYHYDQSPNCNYQRHCHRWHCHAAGDPASRRSQTPGTGGGVAATKRPVGAI